MYATQIHARGNKSPQPVFADGALAEEVFTARSSLAARQPEAALMCAVLEDAVDCFQKQFVCATRRAKRSGQEAEEWLFSDDSKWAFSFISICTALDLGPQYIRQGLKRLHERRQKPSPKQPEYVVRAQQRLMA
ncbi:MAG TPA: hypothetical protein VGK77_13170 [Candidatus Binatia bacterium]|jgi:hypothetical protein